MKIDLKSTVIVICYGIISWQAMRIANSVDTLNVNMASIVATVDQHEKRLDKGGL